MAAESGTSYRGSTRATGAEQTFDLKLIPEFDGSSQPVAEWLEKVELVCELCGVVDVAHVLPLRLTGGAFAVYQQLASEDRRKVEKVKAALRTAFALDNRAGAAGKAGRWRVRERPGMRFRRWPCRTMSKTCYEQERAWRTSP
ncbi:hypothetical protein M514_03182 [Trichuris suis]|uniref:Uncharacterized protein n=1 Tax=Trichuris suis TaxID=68888 RepID=A0A085N957_9BILA|nr:hypothetical protein M513_03182 [Trichuris suis]KFD66003.1 hypothetical protein M514_03182 [Trichuris suis]